MTFSAVPCRASACILIAAMFTARKKIVKEKGAEPDEFEDQVAQASQAAVWKYLACCLGEVAACQRLCASLSY